jgi:hypothetical protein
MDDTQLNTLVDAIVRELKSREPCPRFNRRDIRLCFSDFSASATSSNLNGASSNLI